MGEALIAYLLVTLSIFGFRTTLAVASTLEKQSSH